MLLNKLTIQNFKCYESIIDVPFHRLTVFIGENDSGKTVLLDALEILLTNKTPAATDYRRIGENEATEEILLSGTFEIEPGDIIPDELRPLEGNEFLITKKFTLKTVNCQVLGRGFENPALNTFEKENAET